MRRVLISAVIIILLIQPVSGVSVEFSEQMHVDDTYDSTSFWEDLWSVTQKALSDLRPDIAQTMRVCVCLVGSVLLYSVIFHYSGETKQIVRLVMSISTGVLLLHSSHNMIELGKETIGEISEYGKLILPVLTGALAAQGGTTMSAALYTGTALFSTILTTAIFKVLIPLLYMYLCLCIACGFMSDEMLSNIRKMAKWLLTWGLKLILYFFTGYMSISGVISGTVDASALKATKLAISGVVPVVGSIFSDASEVILLSAGVMKNSVGAYGLVVILSMIIGPFLKISVHYLLLKITAASCSVLAPKEITDLMFDFSGGMGFVLAMTGVSCLLLMIGIVCFMKGVG